MAVHVSGAGLVDQLLIPGVYTASLREAAEREFGWDDPSTLILDDAAATVLEESVAARHQQLLTDGDAITCWRNEVGGTGHRMPPGGLSGSRRFTVTPDDVITPRRG